MSFLKRVKASTTKTTADVDAVDQAVAAIRKLGALSEYEKVVKTLIIVMHRDIKDWEAELKEVEKNGRTPAYTPEEFDIRAISHMIDVHESLLPYLEGFIKKINSIRHPW